MNQVSSIQNSVSGQSPIVEEKQVTLASMAVVSGLSVLVALLVGVAFIVLTGQLQAFYKGSLALLGVPLVVPYVYNKLRHHHSKLHYLVTALVMTVSIPVTYVYLALMYVTDFQWVEALTLSVSVPPGEILSETMAFVQDNGILLVGYIALLVAAIVLMFKKPQNMDEASE